MREAFSHGVIQSRALFVTENIKNKIYLYASSLFFYQWDRGELSHLLWLYLSLLPCVLFVATATSVLMLRKKMIVVSFLFCFPPLLSGPYVAKLNILDLPYVDKFCGGVCRPSWVLQGWRFYSTFRQSVLNHTCYGKVYSLSFLQGELLNLCLFWFFRVRLVLLSDNFIFLHWWNFGKKNI